ncbi:monofunctional biosynthetic peptidoglycan transglycosylase [Aureimonas mangrovi]|uniref:monofunctional biosynthetic peptidoglycan transglycosylase n=1 Tax=Aureimonas mangrovi TaxID=2758041 RepID=UPI00163D73BB|nr:monofunctional biosynthetic peptidoglycan transglycosylase [Aureimonas mangrovi]
MLRRILRLIVVVALVLAAIPLLLVPIYASPALRPLSTLMLAEHFTFQPFDRQWVPLDGIAPVLVHSVMMSEDGQFCAHDGIDWTELSAVIDQALAEGSGGRGASTIPMQTVKNLFLWNGRSYLRKGLEVPLAMYADALWSKRRMMEIYLNVAEWGPGIYGIEAAARYYFNRPASDLSARQAALLAASLPAPLARDPANPTAGLARIADRVQARARGSGAYVECLDV